MAPETVARDQGVPRDIQRDLLAAAALTRRVTALGARMRAHQERVPTAGPTRRHRRAFAAWARRAAALQAEWAHLEAEGAALQADFQAFLATAAPLGGGA